MALSANKSWFHPRVKDRFLSVNKTRSAFRPLDHVLRNSTCSQTAPYVSGWLLTTWLELRNSRTYPSSRSNRVGFNQGRVRPGSRSTRFTSRFSFDQALVRQSSRSTEFSFDEVRLRRGSHLTMFAFNQVRLRPGSRSTRFDVLELLTRN